MEDAHYIRRKNYESRLAMAEEIRRQITGLYVRLAELERLNARDAIALGITIEE